MNLKYLNLLILLLLFYNCSSTPKEETKSTDNGKSAAATRAANTAKDVVVEIPDAQKEQAAAQQAKSAPATARSSAALSQKIQWAQNAREGKDKTPWYDSESAKQEAPKEIGSVTFLVGAVKASSSKANPRSLKKGDKVYEGEIVETAEKATCDMELNLAGAPNTVVRLREKSTLKVSHTSQAGEKKGPIMGGGSALFHFKNVDQKNGVKVETPTWIAGVRGTEFEINTTDENSQKVAVNEGKVVVSSNLPELELLTKKDGEMEKKIKSRDIEVEPGYSAKFSNEEETGFLKKSGLSSLLKESDKPEFETKLNEHAKSEGFLSEFGSYFTKAKDSLAKMLDSEVESAREEFDEMTSFKYNRLPELLAAKDKKELYEQKEFDLDRMLRVNRKTCGGSKIPEVFTDSCSESHVLLKQPVRSNEIPHWDLYWYYNLSNENYNERQEAYKYFRTNCETQFIAVKEKLNSRLALHTIGPDEKSVIKATINTINSCSK